MRKFTIEKNDTPEVDPRDGKNAALEMQVDKGIISIQTQHEMIVKLQERIEIIGKHLEYLQKIKYF